LAEKLLSLARGRMVNRGACYFDEITSDRSMKREKISQLERSKWGSDELEWKGERRELRTPSSDRREGRRRASSSIYRIRREEEKVTKGAHVMSMLTWWEKSIEEDLNRWFKERMRFSVLQVAARQRTRIWKYVTTIFGSKNIPLIIELIFYPQNIFIL
jgi:hypothetical protein